jgi:hypothetical protein
MPLPRLRSLLKIVDHQLEGKPVFLAIDGQEGLFDHQVVLPPLAFVVAYFLDGRRDAEAVRKEIADKLQGTDIPADRIEQVVRELDEHYLLETDRAAGRRREIAEEYAARSARPARFVTGSAEEVGRQLDGYYAGEAGAGQPGEGRADSLSGIMAPHIDFPRGGNCYTFAYKELAERSAADLYVILGVAHLSPENPFVVTAKNYETPLGTVETDREAVAELEKRLGRRIFEYESYHRSEHSAEFQAVFLKHARKRSPFTIVPILCSSFERWCGGASPSTAPEVREFLDAMAETLAGRKACIVAGVDFAHVGPVFGDSVKLDDKRVEWMVAGDGESLQACKEGNAEAFWNGIMADGNARHVCGLSATYAALRLLDGAQGKVLKYGFAPDPGGGIVSFASMAFSPRPRIVAP